MKIPNFIFSGRAMLVSPIKTALRAQCVTSGIIGEGEKRNKHRPSKTAVQKP
ncbi:MAG: hypothetical protein ETSY1_28095 [Candidatus Entotheonella factor]|uniref:Uncharacterized protein n=1 Tax=Entotheonella factor TaxID=1429438 RepID=W4LDP3_ENTF1|nr:MAG: hypothetical protein ETSY1_28095 [Candidatus Entotheonella factor]